VQIDPDELRRYYASLSDESLLELDRGELTDIAVEAYDSELAQRGLDADSESGSESDSEAGDPGWQAEPGDGEPDWLDEASCACTFPAGRPGDRAAPEADHALAVLKAAGIPCHLVANKLDPPAALPDPPYEYGLMVPTKFHKLAESVLDKQISNLEVEAEWKMYFDSLSDEELRDVDSEGLFAGLRDRLDRATRAYQEALTARGLSFK
jgi:hypothetical protein